MSKKAPHTRSVPFIAEHSAVQVERSKRIDATVNKPGINSGLEYWLNSHRFIVAHSLHSDVMNNQSV